MDKAENPEIQFTPKMQEIRKLSEKSPKIEKVLETMLGVPEKTKKGGASHELSSNGIWSFSDVKKSSADKGKKKVDSYVDQAVKFIETWKMVKSRYT